MNTSVLRPSNRVAAASRLLARLCAAGAVVGLAACAASVPAPIEHRAGGARPQDVRAQRTAPAPVAEVRPVAPAAPAAPAGQTAPGVQVVPIPQRGSVEARPLEARPSVPATAGAAAPSRGQQPRGLKRPYSDTALAEMARADTPATEPARAPEPRPAPEARPEPRPPVAEARPAPEPRPAEPRPDAAPRAEAGGDWVWPVAGRVLQNFEEGRNKGIAIAGKSGDPVSAVADGKVIYSGVVRGYGNLVIVKHGTDLLSVYAHNRALSVKEGDNVRRGQKIAEVGDTDADRVKLHFEVRRQGRPVDPLKLLPARQS